MITTIIRSRGLVIAGLLLCLGITVSCTLDMRDQPRYDPFEESRFFADRAAARPRIPNTVARGQLNLDGHLYTGRVDGRFAETFPFAVTMEILERGQERYTIFCAPCHGLLGDGEGVITEYGMRMPTSFHDPDLRDEPPGYYFSIITDGTRVMPSYAARVTPADRWAIIAYIRALQLSQNAAVEQVPPDILPELDETDTGTP
ncbi:MAG: cytochrome c [Caldilineaceae bacterium]|nr:cytochrome c [Caldilineaceae bacterium]